MTVKVPRPYVVGEIRYVIDAIHRFFPNRAFETEFVLGVHPMLRKYPPRLEAMIKEMSGVYARADAVVWEDSKVTIIEGKLMPRKFIDAWGRLMVYKELWKFTPRIIEREIERAAFVLITPVETPLVQRFCYENNIRNIIWEPPYYDKVLEKYRPTYKTIPEYERRLKRFIEKKKE